MTFRVSGDAEFQRLAKELREAGHTGVGTRTAAALRAVVKPMAREIVREGAEDLPVRGGLRARVSRYRTDVDIGLGREPRVSIRIAKVAGYNAGRLRHPTFGNHEVWVAQEVPASAEDYTTAFDRRAQAAIPEVHKAMQDTLNDVARKV